jgi:hypothetical protein
MEEKGEAVTCIASYETLGGSDAATSSLGLVLVATFFVAWNLVVGSLPQRSGHDESAD